MKKSIKSFIAKLLVLCMVVGMLPAFSMAMGSTAAAADNPYYSVSVDTEAELSGTTAEANITSTKMDRAIDNAIEDAKKEGTDPVLEVNIEIPAGAKADGLSVSLPASSLQKLAKEEGATLAINSDVVSVELDSVALDALAKDATGTVTLSCEPATLTETQQTLVSADAKVIDLSISCGGNNITTYGGGNLTISVPYTLPEGVDAKDVVVYYLNGDNLDPCDTTYVAGQVSFTTTHLSKYVIDTAAEEPEPVKLTATSTLAVGVDGGTITLTTNGAAFAETASAADFTLTGDTALTVTDVKVNGKNATLTVTGTPAESETITVTAKKEAFAAAEAEASAKVTVSMFTFKFTFETKMVDGELVLNMGIKIFLRGTLLVNIPVQIPLG